MTEREKLRAYLSVALAEVEDAIECFQAADLDNDPYMQEFGIEHIETAKPLVNSIGLIIDRVHRWEKATFSQYQDEIEKKEYDGEDE